MCLSCQPQFHSRRSNSPYKNPPSGFVCPGRADDRVNQVRGSKPIPVDVGARETYSEPQVAFQLTVEAELSSYNRSDTITRLASLYQVDPSDITIRLVAGSLVLNVSIRTDGADGGVALRQMVEEVDAAALSESLGAASCTLVTGFRLRLSTSPRNLTRSDSRSTRSKLRRWQRILPKDSSPAEPSSEC